MTKSLLVVVICCLSCAPAERSEPLSEESSVSDVVAEREMDDELEPCDPGTEEASVIPEQDPQDFRYRILPDGYEQPDDRAHPATEIKAEYTRAAILNRVQGIVILEVGVRADGSVAGARVLKGLPCGLESNAIEAVHDTEFVPGSLNGEPIDSITTVSIKFTLPAR